jgi:RNA polymerase sigma-70 factor (ECF subfamily)
MDSHTNETTNDQTLTTFDQAWSQHRAHMFGLAFRMLGSHAEAEDVVQETFSRLALVPLAEIDDVRGWLVVVMRRLCLDRIRSAHARRESASGADPSAGGHSAKAPAASDPADRATLDDQVQRALAVVLDRLTPAERTAFVLHDVFGFPFVAVAEIVGRTPAACRQLASRARRSIRSSPPASSSQPSAPDAATVGHRLLTERFIAACAGGDITELMEVLDPEVVGVATLVGDGRRGFQRLEGRPVVARRLLSFVGATTERVLVPVDVEHHLGVVVFDHGRVAALLVLQETDGLINHIDTFVNGLTDPRRAGRRAEPRPS